MKYPSFSRQILSGKTLARALFNDAVAKHAAHLSGSVLDLAGRPSYAPFLPKDAHIERTNLSGPGLDRVVDFNEPLLYADASFDHALLFNALYIAREPQQVLKELRRVVKPRGTVLIASPFIQGEMREPHDYGRLSSEGLERLAKAAGYVSIDLHPYGERFSAAANLLHPALLSPLIRLPAYALACLLDRAIPAKVREEHPAPIGYFCVLRTGA